MVVKKKNPLAEKSIVESYVLLAHDFLNLSRVFKTIIKLRILHSGTIGGGADHVLMVILAGVDLGGMETEL